MCPVIYGAVLHNEIYMSLPIRKLYLLYLFIMYYIIYLLYLFINTT